jgi:NADH-quinone oxidoreductase subunit G
MQNAEEGLDVNQILNGQAKAVLLLNVEPGLDTALDGSRLGSTQMVVTLSPFKTNLNISDVLLPIAPFTETSGTFVNAEGRAQSFHAVVKPLGDTRPAWKVLRVLANLLSLKGFEYESSQDVLDTLGLSSSERGLFLPPNILDNTCTSPIVNATVDHIPCTATIYQLDGLVRRSPSLQLTMDARSMKGQEVTS